MDNTGMRQAEREYHELLGAIYATNTLKEALELRLGEARDECAREALDNIISLIETQNSEYQRRKNDLCSPKKT